MADAFFQLGPLTIRYYGLIIAVAILAGYLLLAYRSKYFGREIFRHAESAFLLVLPLAIIGARLYYVIFSWDFFRDNPGSIFAIWQGGLAIHGALIGGAIGFLIYARWRKVNLWRLLDFAAPSVILGQAIGRWGNFFNQEAFGGPTNLPWGIPIDTVNRPEEFIAATHFHPTFLYESLWNIVVLGLLLWLARRWHKQGRRPGYVIAAYLVLYSLGRFFIEALRTDSLYLGPLRVAQLVSLLAIIGGIAFFLYQKRKTPKLPVV